MTRSMFVRNCSSKGNMDQEKRKVLLSWRTRQEASIDAPRMCSGSKSREKSCRTDESKK